MQGVLIKGGVPHFMGVLKLIEGFLCRWYCYNFLLLSEPRSHEWQKHGTCAGTGIHQYFSTVLNLYKSGLSFDAILSKSGIFPSFTKTYHVC